MLMKVENRGIFLEFCFSIISFVSFGFPQIHKFYIRPDRLPCNKMTSAT